MSVAFYNLLLTGMGYGLAVLDADIIVPIFFPTVMLAVEVEVVSRTSVRVSWNMIEIPVGGVPLQGYTVYYRQKMTRKKQSELSVTVPSYENNVVIENLITNMVYEFEVATVMEQNGETIMGVRSSVVEAQLIDRKLYLPYMQVQQG